MGQRVGVQVGNQYYRDVMRRLAITMPSLDWAAVDRAIADRGATPETVTETQMRRALRGLILPLLEDRGGIAAVASVQAGLITTDAADRVRTISAPAATLVGLPPDTEIIGRSVEALPALAGCVPRVASFAEADAVHVEECVIAADQRRVQCISHLRVAEDGCILGVSTTIQDVTFESAVYAEAGALYAESEARVRKLTALAEIARLVALATDLDATLAAIAERTTRLTGCRAAAIFLPDDSRHLALMGQFGLPDDYCGTINGFLRTAPALAEEWQTPTTLAFRDRAPAHRNLLAIPPDAPPEAVATRSVGLAHGWASIVAVPLVAQDAAIGTLTCYLAEPEPPPDETLRLITTIADQAALAVRNSTLYAETQRQLTEMTALHRSAALLNARLDRAVVLQTIVEQAAQVTGAWVCTLHELTASGDGTVMRAVSQEGHSPFPDIPVFREGPAIYAIRQRAPMIIRSYAEAAAMPWWKSEYGKRLEPSALRGMIVIPFGYEGAWNAALMLIYNRAIDPSESEMQLIGTFADHAAVAMHNAQLYEQAQQAAALEERHRLARDLHDSVTQSLFSMSLLAQVLPTLAETQPDEAKRSLEELRRLAKEALAEMRALLFQLRPVALEEEGLVEALRKHIESLQRRDGPALSFTTAADAGRLPLSIEEALFRVASEAVGNALKHARATRIAVTLATERGVTTLTVRDDGRGFDPQGHQAEPGHLGLPGMRERVASIGGRLAIESAPGAGTAVHVQVVASSAPS